MMKSVVKYLKKIDWSNHLIELIVVFIGISGAFSLNNWNDSRKARDQEEKYLVNILADVNNSINNLKINIEQTKKDSVQNKELIELLSSENINLKSILPLVAEMSSMAQFTARNSTFESLKSSGGLQLIENFELRNQIVQTYLSFDKISTVEKITFNFINDYLIPLTLKKFDLIKGKVVDMDFVKENHFRNLVVGYQATIYQQKNSYYDALKSCEELKIALQKELN